MLNYVQNENENPNNAILEESIEESMNQTNSSLITKVTKVVSKDDQKQFISNEN